MSVSEGTNLRTEETEEETDHLSETAQTAVANLVVGGESDEVVVIEAGIYLQNLWKDIFSEFTHINLQRSRWKPREAKAGRG